MPDSDHEIPFLIGSDFAERRNVAWRVELGTPDPHNPLIEPESPWDDGVTFMHGTVLRDSIDGLWKAWGTATPNGTFHRRLVYYESEDGVDWRRPELDVYAFEGHERTNILLSFDTGGNSIYASVLVDADAPEGQRYQMYVMRRPHEPEHKDRSDIVKGFETPDGPARDRGLYRYASRDGIHWQPDVGPLLINDADILRPDAIADGIFIYRQPDGTFVAYHKTGIPGFPGNFIPYELGPGSCRVLVRRTSSDGIHWKRHEHCMMPDWRDPADTQFMEMSVTPAAGGYIGVLTVYRTGNETLELQFAASRDGRYWWRPDRRACVSQPPLGDYGGGMTWGTHHVVSDGDRIHYYYGGMEGIHGDIFDTEAIDAAAREGKSYRALPLLHGERINRESTKLIQHGALCRATWWRGRLWGLTVASGGNIEGSATTSGEMRRGEVLHVNACTVKDGEILAELVGADGSAVPGFDREACDGFSGDALAAGMTWKGNATAPADGLRARFILRRARLYGFEFGRDHG